MSPRQVTQKTLGGTVGLVRVLLGLEPGVPTGHVKFVVLRPEILRLRQCSASENSACQANQPSHSRFPTESVHTYPFEVLKLVG